MSPAERARIHRYLIAHGGQKPPKQLAEELEAPIADVRNALGYLKRMGLVPRTSWKHRYKDDERPCLACGRTLPFSAFSMQRNPTSGRYHPKSRCRECVNRQQLDQYHSDPEYRRKNIDNAKRQQRKRKA